MVISPAVWAHCVQFGGGGFTARGLSEEIKKRRKKEKCSSWENFKRRGVVLPKTLQIRLRGTVKCE